MTDETPITPAPHGATPALPATPPVERARIEAPPPRRKKDALPVLYLIGFVILASALVYLWRHPAVPGAVIHDAARVDTLQQQAETRRQEMAALATRLTAIEARPAPAAAAAANLAPIEGRLSELERRPAATQSLGPVESRIAALEGKASPPPPDLTPIEGRIAALEGKAPPNLAPIESRIAALEGKPPPPPVDLGPITSRLDAIEARLTAAETQAKQTVAAMSAVTDRAQRTARVQTAVAALEAGQKLGDIPNAPPALAKFAAVPPPTEPALRQSFTQAAQSAQRASQPPLADDQSLATRMWVRAQQTITVRQGDKVLVGDPIGGVIAAARQALDAGDLAAAVKALDALSGPAKAAMADWVAQARSVLDARAALNEMAARF